MAKSRPYLRNGKQKQIWTESRDKALETRLSTFRKSLLKASDENILKATDNTRQRFICGYSSYRNWLKSNLVWNWLWNLYSFLSDPVLRAAVRLVLQKDPNPRPVPRVVIPALLHQTAARLAVPRPPRNAMAMQTKSQHLSFMDGGRTFCISYKRNLLYT